MPPHRPILTPTDADAAPSPSAVHRSNLIIAAACLLAAAFFLALTYYAVFNRRRRAPRVTSLTPHADVHDHHPWRIRTVGLDAAAISSIKILIYNDPGTVINTADCSVCLTEFTDGESVRLLPKCSHAFHVECIDMWLTAHVNCPLCRSPVVLIETVEEGSVQLEEVEEHFADVSGELSVSVEMEEGVMEEEKECGGGDEGKGSTSKEAEKSVSGSGRSFFFTKNGRSRSGVLPL